MLSQKEADEFVLQSDLPENEEALSRRLSNVSKAHRQLVIQENPESLEGVISSAIEIQRVWRGYSSRANMYEVVQPGVSKTAVYSGSIHAIMRQEDFLGYDESGKEKSAARMRLEAYYGDFVCRFVESQPQPGKVPSFEEFCATYLQDWWQDIVRRRKAAAAAAAGRAAQLVKKPVRVLTPREAATMIQKAWRRHIDIQVYRYYRDLINFKTRGNPALMLRCINPQEAKMLDAASGIHIKFRLAGDRFPPNIYYKIFTHRPIQDLCANSPKDYTMATVKIKMCKDEHNRFRQSPGDDDHQGWYVRLDNNGWRLVSDRLIHHILSDPVTWETSRKKYEYHHDKMVRKQDVEKRKKKKKIQWMQKMYKDGMLKAKSDDKETIQLIEGAAAGMVATVENYGADALEDWEVDELLDWTTSLNFEDYQNSWKELATSANSEKQAEDKMRLFTSTADPYEFTLSTGVSRYQSSQPSRNTPVSSDGSPGRGHAQAVNS